jgi:hypothetical protein
LVAKCLARQAQPNQLKLSGQLNAPVIVAVIAVRMMQVAADQVINMVAVRNCLVAAAWAVIVSAFELRRATDRIRGIDRNYVLVDMITVNVMQAAVVQIIDVVPMADRNMTALRTVLVGVVGVLLLCASCHVIDPCFYIRVIAGWLHAQQNRRDGMGCTNAVV